MTQELKACAKLNLTLRVLGRRVDGFHEIESIFIPVPGLYDLIVLEPSDGPGIEVICNVSELADLDRNLAARAARVFCEWVGVHPRWRIQLTKRIPIGAGLGGGSSNAAAVLKGLNELLGFPLGEQQLVELAAEVGSDVPFFLYGRAAIVRGRGEILEVINEKLVLLDGKWVLIVYPGFSIRSGWAYSKLGLERGQSFSSPGRLAVELVALLQGTDQAWADLKEGSVNDLEQPVFTKYPILALYREFLEREAGALYARMSGSGSVVYGIFESENHARHVAELMRPRFGRIWTGVFPLELS